MVRPLTYALVLACNACFMHSLADSRADNVNDVLSRSSDESFAGEPETVVVRTPAPTSPMQTATSHVATPRATTTDDGPAPKLTLRASHDHAEMIESP